MTYDKKDPREHMIDEVGARIWEVSDRVEERYNWQGCFLDLCNQDPSEFVKNPIIEAIKSGATPTPVPPSGATTVKLTTDYADTEKTAVSISIDGEIKSAFVVVMEYNDTEKVSTTITPDTPSPVILDAEEPITIVNAMLLGYTEETATSDTLKVGDIIYKISKPGVSPETPECVCINLNSSIAKSLSDEELIAKIKTEGFEPEMGTSEATAIFEMEPVYVDNLDNIEDEDEVDRIIDANHEMFFVACSKPVIGIFEGSISDEAWVINDKEIEYEGVKYYVSYSDDIDNNNVVDSAYAPVEATRITRRITF